ncbi:MAG: thioredoxin [Verrucomicrobiales bacterium]
MKSSNIAFLLSLPGMLLLASCGPKAAAPDSDPGASSAPENPEKGGHAQDSAHHVVALDAAGFQAKVIDTPGVALVDFWAEWCGPCKTLAPTVEKVAAAYEGRVLVGKVDVDSETGLAQKYSINSIPALLVFKDGKKVDEIIGVAPRDKIEATLEKHLQ